MNRIKTSESSSQAEPNIEATIELLIAARKEHRSITSLPDELKPVFATLIEHVASELGWEVGEYTHWITSLCHDRSAVSS